MKRKKATQGDEKKKNRNKKRKGVVNFTNIFHFQRVQMDKDKDKKKKKNTLHAQDSDTISIHTY